MEELSRLCSQGEETPKTPVASMIGRYRDRQICGESDEPGDWKEQFKEEESHTVGQRVQSFRYL